MYFLIEFYGTASWFIYGMIFYFLAVGKNPGWASPVEIDISTLERFKQPNVKGNSQNSVETWKDKYGFHMYCQTCKMQRFP